MKSKSLSLNMNKFYVGKIIYYLDIISLALKCDVHSFNSQLMLGYRPTTYFNTALKIKSDYPDKYPDFHNINN